MDSDCYTPARVGSPTYLAGMSPGPGDRKEDREPVYEGTRTVRVKATTAMSSPNLFRVYTRPSLLDSAQARLLHASRGLYVRRAPGSPVLPRPHPVGRLSPDGGGSLPGG
jgi:hypothetical protein